MQYKIKLLGAKTGQGHISILKAVEEEFLSKDIAVNSCPSFYEDSSISNEVLSNFNNMISMKSVELSVQLNDFFVLEGKQIDERKYESYLTHFRKELMDENQVVISFTPLINKYVLKFLKNHNPKSKFYIVVTDPYDPMYPGFDAKGANAYFCTNETSKEQLVKSGISERNIVITGFPLRRCFLENNTELTETHKRFASLNKKVVLINCGAYGNPKYISLIKEILLQPFKKYYYIIVCGNSSLIEQMLKSYIKSQKIENISVLGYVTNMHELLSIATFCITKAGANTIHECIACGVLPLIVGFWGLQYQERGVFNYLEKYYDINIKFNSTQELLEYLNKPLTKVSIKEKKVKIKGNKLNGAEIIVEKILEDTSLKE